MFRILVVERQNTRLLLQAVWKRALYGRDGRQRHQALETDGKEHIDLVVLDILIPGWMAEFTNCSRSPERAADPDNVGQHRRPISIRALSLNG